MIAALGSLAAPNPTFRFLSRGRQSSRGLSAPLTTAAAGGEISDPNGIMNEQFMSVLKDSLSRQGEEALTEGPEADEFRKCATVEMLEGALQQSVNSLRQMNAWKQQIDQQVLAQEKQVQRLNFALTKAKNDAAYMSSMKKMLYDGSD
jgi:hypothetical protein